MRRPNTLLWLVPAVGLAAGFFVAPAEAAPTRQQCVAAYEETQVSMRRSHLLAARASIQMCLDEACPAVLRGDCAGWLKEVESRTPSVVVECVADGAPVREARLFVDGNLHEAGLDGKAMELDPGAHTFRIETAAPGASPVSADALLREGEKLKVVRIDLTPAGPKVAAKDPVDVPDKAGNGGAGARVGAGEEPSRRPVPSGAYVFGALGLVAAAGFTTFAILGTVGKSDLEPCKPNCSEDRIDTVRTKYIVADVFLGVGVLSLLAAGYFYLTRPPVSADARDGRAARVGSDGTDGPRLRGGALVF